MTLNISLLSRNVMAQSSDLQLTNPDTGALVEDASPKQVDITYFAWRAVIGYSGVAKLGGQDTHKWLVDLLAYPMGGKEPQMADVVELIRQKASRALATVPLKNRRHTFVILAFEGRKPIAYMISNHQRFDARDSADTATELFVTKYRPGRATVRLAGGGSAEVTRTDKRLLRSLLRSGQGDDAIGKALASVNRRVNESFLRKNSSQPSPVSEGCVTHVLRAEGSGGYVIRAEVQKAIWPQSLMLGLNTPQLIANLITKRQILLLTPTARVERSTEDGNWTNAANLSTPRMDHTATLLMNGQVLVAGGRNGPMVHASAEVYSPELQAWLQVGSMANKRHGHRATALLDGRVLITGGQGTDLGSCEIFDPTTYQWSATTRLQVSRYNHTSTLLPSGLVLVAGGLGEGGALADVGLYDPVSDVWIKVDALKVARRDHTATLLSNGTVLVAGGMDSRNAPLGEAEVFDPRTGGWSLIASMNYPHSRHTATLLRDSHVLIVGTRDQQTAEIYDPNRRSWKETRPLSIERHSGHAATSLVDGSVLISGGQGPEQAFLATTERYIDEQGKWEFFDTLAIDRTMHTATLLKDGTVLVVGGGTVDGA